MRILVVEDDGLLGDAIEAGLAQRGFAVDWVRDGVLAAQIMTGADAGDYAAVVLDLGLPRRDGLSILKELRQRGSGLPVLILTARDRVEDRIGGLDQGADDYLLKPFDMGELAARLRALIRRADGQAAPIVEAGDIRLDPAARSVTVGGDAVELAAKEFSLLEALMLNKGRVLSRPQLEQQLYSWNDETGSNTVEVYIHHLRRKLGRDCIVTIRGVGYMFRKD